LKTIEVKDKENPKSEYKTEEVTESITNTEPNVRETEQAQVDEINGSVLNTQENVETTNKIENTENEETFDNKINDTEEKEKPIETENENIEHQEEEENKGEENEDRQETEQLQTEERQDTIEKEEPQHTEENTIIEESTTTTNVAKNRPQIILKINPKAQINVGTNTNKALILAMLKNYLADEKSRINLFTSIKNFTPFKPYFIQSLISENEDLIKKFGELSEKYSNDPTVEAQISKLFAPSKTAQNGLNFLTKDEEGNLAKKDQPNEIINIFKLVYVLVNESYEHLPLNQLIPNLLTNIFPKLKIESLKSYYLNTIGKTINISTNQHEKLTKILADNPKLLNSSELLKINRCVSYMTFMVKEILDYASQKTSDGTYVVAIRDAKLRLNKLIEKVEKLKAQVN